MRPILFHIAGHPIHSFGVMVALGFLAALGWTLLEARRVGRDPALFVDALWRVALGGVLGARLLYVAIHPEELRGKVRMTVAGGRIAHVEEGGPGLDHLVISDDPAAEQPRLRFAWDPPGVRLSPTGTHVVTIAPVTGDVVVTEIPSGGEVALDDGQYSDGLIPLQWVGDDVLYAAGTPRGDDAADVVRCTIPTGPCRVVAEAVGPAGQVQAPSGEKSPMGMNVVVEKMAHSTP